MRIEQFEYIEAWQLVQELIRKVNERKIEQEKMNIDVRLLTRTSEP